MFPDKLLYVNVKSTPITNTGTSWCLSEHSEDLNVYALYKVAYNPGELSYKKYHFQPWLGSCKSNQSCREVFGGAAAESTVSKSSNPWAGPTLGAEKTTPGLNLGLGSCSGFVSGFVSFCCVPGQNSSVKEIFYLDWNFHGKISTLWATELKFDSGSAPPGPRFPFVKVV